MTGLERRQIKGAACVLMTFLWLMPIAAWADDSEVAIFSPGQAIELDGDEGLALFELVIDGTAPSMNVARLSHRKSTPPPHDEPVSRKRSSVVRLDQAPTEWVVLRLREGWYQITEVDAPFFELPYRLDTSDDPLWRFCVVPGKTAYAGRLFIAKERRTDFVEVTLESRIAFQFETLQAHRDDWFGDANLIYGRAIPDPYVDTLLENWR
ncbi:MAG: hypothetical protein AAF610_00365 [Pseudomonadota bacterium]